MKSKAGRVAAFITTLGVSAGLVGVAAQTTGAYFSDSSTGAIAGNIGSIDVRTSGGDGTDGLNFTFENMLPGERQTATGSYQNVGRNQQDVWLVFHDAAALGAINDLGRYGEAHVASNGTEIFASRNLNDNPSCPPGSANPGDDPCAALPRAIKLGDNVAPGAGGTFGISFNFTERLKGATSMGAPFGPLPYKVVATQDGIDPFDANNTVTP